MIGKMFGIEIGSSTSQRIYYDSMSTGNVYPLTVGLFRTVNQRYAPTIMANWSDYSKCKFQIVEIEKDKTYDDLSFLDMQSLIDWVNSNLENNNGRFSNSIIIRIYDVVDPTIPAISKMYGVNKLYGGLVGGGKGRSGSITKCDNIKDSWTAGHQMLRDMWVYQMPWASSLTAEDFMNIGGNYACWTSRNSMKKFNLPKSKGVTISNTHSGRKIANNNFESFQPASSSESFTLENPQILSFLENGHGSEPPIYSIFDPIGSGSRATFNVSTLSQNYASSVVFYRVKGEGTEDINWAIFIKPFGIDAVVINYVDFSKYDLEFILSNRVKQKFAIKRFNPVNVSRSDAGSDSMLIIKYFWIFTPFTFKTISNDIYSKGGITSWEVFLRLRDKVSGEVSAFSSSKIIAEDSAFGFKFTTL